MSTPAEVVSAQFDNATAYADSALAQLATFIDALSARSTPTPTFDVTWTAIDAPTAVTMPSRPGELATILAAWCGTRGPPTTVDPTAPDIEIDDFTDVAPTLTIPAGARRWTSATRPRRLRHQAHRARRSRT
jgi:hypothetical protein